MKLFVLFSLFVAASANSDGHFPNLFTMMKDLVTHPLKTIHPPNNTHTIGNTRAPKLPHPHMTPPPPVATAANPSLPTIAEILMENEKLSTVSVAIKMAGLKDTLNGPGTFTLFAPNNQAFDKHPSDNLAQLLDPDNVQELGKLLMRHVLPTTNLARNIPQGETNVKTIGGEKITLRASKYGVTIDSPNGHANVVTKDILASNGVVHIINNVI